MNEDLRVRKLKGKTEKSSDETGKKVPTMERTKHC